MQNTTKLPCTHLCKSPCTHFTTYKTQSRSTHNDRYTWFLKFNYKTRVGENVEMKLCRTTLSCEKNDAISSAFIKNNTFVMIILTVLLRMCVYFATNSLKHYYILIEKTLKHNVCMRCDIGQGLQIYLYFLTH